MVNPLITDERIDEEVRKALATTLRLEPNEIDLEGSVVNDLGGTSIDFLDVNFRLENAFGIQLATQLLLDHVEEVLGEGKAIDRNNQITEGAARLLKLYLGERPGLEAGMYADEVPTLVTPRVLVRSVRGIVDHLPASCSHCDAHDWQCEDGAKVVCGACGKTAEYPDGDTLTRQWIEEVEKEHGFFAGA